VELCSLTLQREDLSVANLISSGLFADGAAAVIVTGAEFESSGPEISGPKILATRSVFYPGTEEMMGWNISEKGFRILLSTEVPNLIRQNLGRDVDSFWRTTDTGEATFKAGFYTPEDRKYSRPPPQHWGCTMDSWMPPGIACVR
jgi:predicted naringenin-chalcone synthase